MFAAGMASSGPTLWAFSIFVHPMTDELGWSRGTLFGALAVRSLAMAVLAPFVGRLADNLEKPRPFMVVGGTLYAIGLASLSTVHSTLAYYLIFVCVLGLGLTISGGYARTAYVSKWFVRKRGRAITMGTLGTAVAAFIYPVFTQFCIDEVGWRSTWVILGAMSFILIVPFAFIIRRQPEDMGLLPDGDTPETAHVQTPQERSAPKREEATFTLKEALHTRAFWLLIATSLVIAPITGGGLSATWVPHFRDIGISANTAALSLTIYGLFSIISRFVWGYFVDRYHVRQVLIVLMTMASLALALLLNVQSATLAIIYSAYQGLVMGGYVGINPLVYPTYFGRRHVGAIQGTAAPMLAVGHAIGPFLNATVFDLTGSYRGAYFFMMFAWLAAAILMFQARPPSKTDTPPSVPSTEGLSDGLSGQIPMAGTAPKPATN